jgi:hypothetical protein
MFSLIVTGKMSGVDPQAWLGEYPWPHRRPSGSSTRRTAALELDVTGFRDLGSSGVTMHDGSTYTGTISGNLFRSPKSSVTEFSSNGRHMP